MGQDFILFLIAWPDWFAAWGQSFLVDGASKHCP